MAFDLIPNGAWVDADALRPGHRLLNDDGSWAVVEEVVIRPEPLLAFNLTVAETETYFVAGALDADAVWVHNCDRVNNSSNPARSDHAKDRKAEGRSVSQANQDLQNARSGDFFVDTDTGYIIMRGPKAREHVFDPQTRTHVTTVNKRSKRAHQDRVNSGRLEPASQEQIDSLKDNGED